MDGAKTILPSGPRAHNSYGRIEMLERTSPARARNAETAPLLVNSRTAARSLGISERTLWGLAADGLLPQVRIGRAVRYAVADLQAYIDRQRTGGGTSAAG